MKTPDFLQHRKHVTLLGSESLMNLNIYLDIVLNGKGTLIRLASTTPDHFTCFISLWLGLIKNKYLKERKQLEIFLGTGLVILKIFLFLFSLEQREKLKIAYFMVRFWQIAHVL